MYYTSLNQIKSHNPCPKGWKTLLKALGKTTADDEPVSMEFILQSNGLDDAIWALRCLTGADREIRLFAVKCAREVQYILTDPRSLDALDVAERFANGTATSEELYAAWNAAWNAAWDSVGYAARAAAGAAAPTASPAAAWEVARDAVGAIVRKAAEAVRKATEADRAAACDSAWATARAKQEEIFLKYFG